MTLAKMSYKGFTWPHNPKTCTVSAKRTVAQAKLLGGRWVSQDLGVQGRVISGTGEFSGEKAYQHFLDLYEVFLQDGPGELVHPVLGRIQAVMTSLELLQKPIENYVSYSFSFYQWGDEPQAGAANSTDDGQTTYTLSQGEDFWSVSSLFGLTAEELAHLNPEVSNPARVIAGDTLKVRA